MIQHYDFFVLRRPVATLESLETFSTKTGSALAADLRHWFGDPLHLRALEVASPVFHARVCEWLSGTPLSDEAKIITTLHKYLIRMTTRSTPYGLFAGCTLGRVATQTQLQVSPNDLIINARLDIECLQALKEWLVNQPDIFAQLRLFPNTSLYPAGHSLRFIEQQRESTGRTYYISAVSQDALLTTVFERAQSGVTAAELADAIQTQYAVTIQDARRYVRELVVSQLLQVEIEPTLTGDDYLTRIQRCLDRLTDEPPVINARRVLANLANQLRQHPLHTTGLQTALQDAAIQALPKDVVQIDTILGADHHQLGQAWLNGLQRQLRALFVLNQPFVSADLDEFKRRFYQRYEDEEVPLALALDHEMGIGYGNRSTLGVGSAPLIDTLSFPGTESDAVAPTTAAGWQTFVLNRYVETLRSGLAEIVLTDEDLRSIGRLSTSATPFPSSFYAFGTLLASSPQAVDDDQYLFSLTSCQGPSAVNLMSRFGDADSQLAERIRQCAHDDEAHHPDVILAEIIHFPESRAGNILHRPALHQYEIPYLGKASVPPDFQIPLSDLFVSVRQDRIILRSKRLNKRVIPRLSNAHNFKGGLPVYQFLGNLQYQDASLNLRWNWGLLAQQAYLPRVRYRNVIVSRASWQLSADQFDLNNPVRLVEQLRTLGVPLRFLIVQDDHELRIDAQVGQSLQLLMQELRKTPTLRVVEYVGGPDQCPVRDQAGRPFAHELVIPFRKLNAPAYEPINTAPDQLPQRRFSVGSEWLYLKIYAGEKASDALLVERLFPAIRELIDQQTIQQFFFVRYQDTDPHLRLRFRGNPHLEFYHYVIRRIERALQTHVQSGLVHKIQTDTYQRELERYGPNQIMRCEQVFHHDSLSTLQFMSQTGTTFDENLRFAFAAHKIDRLLEGMGLDVTDRLTLLERLKERYFREFNGNDQLRQQLNERFRTYRSLLEQALSRPFALANGLENWVDEQRPALAALGDTDRTSPRFQTMATSLLHMAVNRLFPSKQRAYELVIYYCLAKHYDSVRARARRPQSALCMA